MLVCVRPWVRVYVSAFVGVCGFILYMKIICVRVCEVRACVSACVHIQACVCVRVCVSACLRECVSA